MRSSLVFSLDLDQTLV